jgi:hypothetical protein
MPSEQAMREELAVAFRVIQARALNDGLFNHCTAQGETDLGGSAYFRELELEPPKPLLTHLHTVYMAYSE